MLNCRRTRAQADQRRGSVRIVPQEVVPFTLVCPVAMYSDSPGSRSSEQRDGAAFTRPLDAAAGQSANMGREMKTSFTVSALLLRDVGPTLLLVLLQYCWWSGIGRCRRSPTKVLGKPDLAAGWRASA